jgi:hypothetical protein
MTEDYQNLTFAELLKAKCQLEANKAKMRIATACYDARKRAEALGVSVEEYLTTPRARKSGRARKLTLETYKEWINAKNNK